MRSRALYTKVLCLIKVTALLGPFCELIGQNISYFTQYFSADLAQKGKNGVLCNKKERCTCLSNTVGTCWDKYCNYKSHY